MRHKQEAERLLVHRRGQPRHPQDAGGLLAARCIGAQHAGRWRAPPQALVALGTPARQGGPGCAVCGGQEAAMFRHPW